MNSASKGILKLEVPLVVRLGSRPMKVAEVVSWVPGAIIELPKAADEDLELMVVNKTIGLGKAVKVGENFGLKVTFVGDVRTRLNAIAESQTGGEATSALDEAA